MEAPVKKIVSEVCHCALRRNTLPMPRDGEAHTTSTLHPCRTEAVKVLANHMRGLCVYFIINGDNDDNDATSHTRRLLLVARPQNYRPRPTATNQRINLPIYQSINKLIRQPANQLINQAAA